MRFLNLLVAPMIGMVLANPVTGEQGKQVVIGEEITLQSGILDEERRLLIHLPNGYEQSTERYPVLYLLDGPAHFHHVTGIVRFLARADRVPPMIVVGIANTDRDRDQKPAADVMHLTAELPNYQATVTFDFPSGGGADCFLRFLAEELTPFIDANYRTADFRLLAGHSSGGLFTLHAMFSRPEAFNAYIAASPSLWWDEQALVKKAIVGPLPDFGPVSRFLYMAVGGEGVNMIGPISELATALELAEPQGLRWWYRVMPAESHTSSPHRIIYDALETIFSDFSIAESTMMAGDVSRLERHLARASETYGYDIPIPESLVNEMGYMQLRLFDRPEKAVEIFQRNAELHPDSANVYDSLADALESADRLSEALGNRNKALCLSISAGDPRTANFENKRNDLLERIEANAEESLEESPTENGESSFKQDRFGAECFE